MHVCEVVSIWRRMGKVDHERLSPTFSMGSLIREIRHVDPSKAGRLFIILEDSHEVTLVVNTRNQAMIRVDLEKLRLAVGELLQQYAEETEGARDTAQSN